MRFEHIELISKTHFYIVLSVYQPLIVNIAHRVWISKDQLEVLCESQTYILSDEIFNSSHEACLDNIDKREVIEVTTGIIDIFLLRKEIGRQRQKFALCQRFPKRLHNHL